MSLEDEDLDSKFISRKDGVTKSPITALHFHIISDWIIAGDQRGSSKYKTTIFQLMCQQIFLVTALDLNLNVTMSCHENEKGAIDLIIPHPTIAGFVTYSANNLQVWNCHFRKPVRFEN